MTRKQVDSKGALLKIGDVAALLYVSVQTVRDWTDAGKLSAVVSSGGHRQYYEADVRKALLASQGVTDYWQAGVTLSVSTSGKMMLLDENFSQVSTPVYKRLSLDKWWGFTNGLEKVSHCVALGDLYVSELSTRFITQSQVGEESVIIVDRTVAHLDRSVVEENMQSVLAETSAWVGNVFMRKALPVWVVREGEHLIPFQ